MKCANHPQTDSVAFCGSCGRALCAECKHDVQGMVYCETCLAARLQMPGMRPLYGPRAGPSPGVALALGFIPGVGAAYCGQVVKGLVQLLIFVSLWGIAERVGVFGWAVAAFWFYIAIDSYQTAKAKQLGQPVPEWFGLGDFRMNAPIGAALLIGLGALLLLDNLGMPVFRHFGRFWPVLLIVIGVILLQRRMGRGEAQPPSSAPPPAPPKEGSGNIPGPHGL